MGQSKRKLNTKEKWILTAVAILAIISAVATSSLVERILQK